MFKGIRDFSEGSVDNVKGTVSDLRAHNRLNSYQFRFLHFGRRVVLIYTVQVSRPKAMI